jgi:hypothetical protein
LAYSLVPTDGHHRKADGLLGDDRPEDGHREGLHYRLEVEPYTIPSKEPKAERTRLSRKKISSS